MTSYRGANGRTDAAGRFEFRDIAGAEVTLEVCRPDVISGNGKLLVVPVE